MKQQHVKAGLRIMVIIVITCVWLTVSAQAQERAITRNPETPVLAIDTGGHMAKIKNVMFTNDGRYLVSASNDKTVRVWDVETGDIVRVIRGQIAEGDEGKIYAAALSPDNRWLAVGGWFKDEVIRLINFRTGEITRLLKGHENVIYGLAFSPDSARLISGSGDKTARIWDVSAGQSLHTLAGHTDDIYAVAFSPDGRSAATGSDDDSLKLWKVQTGERLADLTGHEDNVQSAAFTPDGRTLLSGSWDKTIRLWDGKTGKFIRVMARQDSSIDSFSISPDSKYVLTGIGGQGSGMTCHIFSIPDGNSKISFTQHKNIVLATAVSPDGRLAATGGGSDQEIYLWDVRTGTVKQKLAGKGKQVWSVGFGKDGRTIAWGKVSRQEKMFGGELEQSFYLMELDGSFRLSMGEAVTQDAGYIRGIESAGGVSIRTQDGKIHPTLQILQNGQVKHEITRQQSGDSFYSLSLTPDGKTIIAGTSWELIAFDSSTGSEIRKFVGHTGVVWGVAVSPDGKRLVSGSHDQTVRLWDIATGKNLLTVFHASDGEWVAWTPEGYYDSSVSGDRYVGWHMNQGEDKAALYYAVSLFYKDFRKPLVVAKYLETNGNIDEAIRLANAEAPRNEKTERIREWELPGLFPPLVSFHIPNSEQTTTENNLFCIKAEAVSMNRKEIADIRVIVNGQNWEGRDDKTRAGKMLKGLKASIDQCVYLTEQENRISVIASTADSQSGPKTVQVIWKPKQSVKDIYAPNLYLLAIGISEYKNPENNLKFAHKDAEAVVNAFRSQEGKLYKSVQYRLLINENATQKKIMEGLEWLEQESTQPDMSVIFIAGHGEKDSRNNYYFMPYEGDRTLLRSTGVFWQHFQDVITNLPSKRILMVDTCYSGGITGTRRRGGADITDVIRALNETQSGVVVMTATTGTEVSLENDDWGHGAFTKAFVEGFSEFRADYDQNNSVEIMELFMFIAAKVKALTGGRQRPNTEIPKIINNFPIAVR